MNTTPRFIFNDDGGASRVPGRPIHTAGEFLSMRAQGLVETAVDTISFCTTAGTFGRFYHRTRAGEVADDRRGRYEHSVIPDLLRAGTDPLEVMSGFARRHGRRILWSLRMNDTHDAGNPLLVSRFKEEHPEFLLGSPERQPSFGMWTAVDYGEPRVRELAVAFTAEVLDGYDVDGVELDFFRHPVFFRRLAGERELEAMSGVVRAVRDLVRRASARRGSPRMLAAVVPDSAEYCRSIGLDVEGWLREGLLDLLLVTGYFRLNPWEESVRLARRYGVPVVPCLQEPRLADREGLLLRRSEPSYRARSLCAQSAGMDGVCVYNLFDTSSGLFRDLHDPSALLRSHLTFFPSWRGIGRPAGNPYPYRDQMRIPTLSPDHPARLGPGSPGGVRVPLALPGSIASGLTAGGRSLRLWLRVGGAAVRDLEASWNRSTLRLEGRRGGPLLPDMESGPAADTPGLPPEECWIAASIEPRSLLAGENVVMVGLTASRPRDARLLDVLLEAGPDPTAR